MRVVMVTQAFHPRVGGAERQLLAVAPLLQQRGLDVHVLTRRFEGLAPYEVVHGLPVHRLGSPGSGRGSVVFTAQSQRLLRRLRPDVLHAFELLSPTTTAVLAKAHLPVPVVVKVLGGSELDVVRARPLGAARLRVLTSRVDRFQVVSDDIDRGLAGLGVPRERRVRVENGVDVERYRPPAEGEAAAARGRLPTCGPVVLMVGRLAPEKGVDDLQAAWPRILERHPDALLLVAGGGPESGRLRREAPPRSIHLGTVADVLPLLHAADLLVLPSHTEGSPNAVLEAMACGVPCVVTGVGGSAELADGGRLALQVPPGRPDLLSENVSAALDDPAAGRRRATAARAAVLRTHSLPATVEALMALYTSLGGMQAEPTASPVF